MSRPYSVAPPSPVGNRWRATNLSEALIFQREQQQEQQQEQEHYNHHYPSTHTRGTRASRNTRASLMDLESCAFYEHDDDEHQDGASYAMSDAECIIADESRRPSTAEHMDDDHLTLYSTAQSTVYTTVSRHSRHSRHSHHRRSRHGMAHSHYNNETDADNVLAMRALEKAIEKGAKRAQAETSDLFVPFYKQSLMMDNTYHGVSGAGAGAGVDVDVDGDQMCQSENYASSTGRGRRTPATTVMSSTGTSTRQNKMFLTERMNTSLRSIQQRKLTRSFKRQQVAEQKKHQHKGVCRTSPDESFDLQLFNATEATRSTSTNTNSEAADSDPIEYAGYGPKSGAESAAGKHHVHRKGRVSINDPDEKVQVREIAVPERKRHQNHHQNSKSNHHRSSSSMSATRKATKPSHQHHQKQERGRGRRRSVANSTSSNALPVRCDYDDDNDNDLDMPALIPASMASSSPPPQHSTATKRSSSVDILLGRRRTNDDKSNKKPPSTRGTPSSCRRGLFQKAQSMNQAAMSEQSRCASSLSSSSSSSLVDNADDSKSGNKIISNEKKKKRNMDSPSKQQRKSRSLSRSIVRTFQRSLSRTRRKFQQQESTKAIKTIKKKKKKKKSSAATTTTSNITSARTCLKHNSPCSHLQETENRAHRSSTQRKSGSSHTSLHGGGIQNNSHRRTGKSNSSFTEAATGTAAKRPTSSTLRLTATKPAHLCPSKFEANIAIEALPPTVAEC